MNAAIDREEVPADQQPSEALKHFFRLARRGKYPAASGGEKRAYKLAKAVLDHVPGLDFTAVDGLKEFIDFTAISPQATREAFEGPSP